MDKIEGGNPDRHFTINKTDAQEKSKMVMNEHNCK
jgi:hypothetical protein